jgi:hypothetical protein
MQMLEEQLSEGSKQSQVSDSRCGCCAACLVACLVQVHYMQPVRQQQLVHIL